MGSVARLLEQLLKYLLAHRAEHRPEHVPRHLLECDPLPTDTRRAGPPRRGLP